MVRVRFSLTVEIPQGLVTQATHTVVDEVSKVLGGNFCGLQGEFQPRANIMLYSGWAYVFGETFLARQEDIRQIMKERGIEKVTFHER